VSGVRTSDFVIIGAGIIGLAIAHELISQNPTLSITVLDKENALGAHASGRNSGVLHAGFYYSPESLKAQLTRDGNRMLHEFLTAHDVPVRRTGKVVVASHESDLAALSMLNERALANGVEVSLVSAQQLRDIEPRARTVEQALWSPTTSVADPLEVINAFAVAVRQSGVNVHLGQHVIDIAPGRVTTASHQYEAAHIINAAGLYAERIAHSFGFGLDYVMLPFKGLYWYADLPSDFLHRQVYPVPDMKNPFLGVHVTLTSHGRIKIGPTAIPALWRENYSGLSHFQSDEFIESVRTYPKFLSSPHHNSWKLFAQEFPKYFKQIMVGQAQQLVPTLPRNVFNTRGRVGIRAQLFNTKKRSLEMDFIVCGDRQSTHMLNSVSPAWTSSMAVAQYVVADLRKRQAL